MNIKNYFSFLFLFIFSFSLQTGYTQLNDSLLLINSQVIYPDRYKDYKGSPYLFKSFVPAVILSNNGVRIPVNELNYNGHTKNMEVRSRDQYVELDDRMYIRIEVPVEGNLELMLKYDRPNIILQKNAHSILKGRFGDLMYIGDNVILFSDIYVSLKDNHVNTPGKTVTFKRFNTQKRFYVDIDGELISIKRKKKSLLKALGKSKALSAFIKEHKLDLKSDLDLIKLMAYYDELLEK